MASKKKMYLEVAHACYRNSRSLYLDSLALRKRRSSGHAYSLLVLSIEESVKAVTYRLAADGLVTFSEGDKKDALAVNEKDLLDHKIKHGILAMIIAVSITYSPFYTAFDGVRTRTLAVKKAKDMMMTAIARHQALIADLSDPKSAVSKMMTRFLKLTEELNEEKNAGLYVGRKGTSILLPNRVSRSKYEYWRCFQEGFLEGTKGIVKDGIAPVPLSVLRGARRRASRRLSRAQMSKPNP